jgi:hypothetical protein
MQEVDKPAPRGVFPVTWTVTALVGALGIAAPLAAQDTRPADEIARLREEITALESEYTARLDELERRLAKLEETAVPEVPSPGSPAAEAAPPEDELARLRAAAAEAARQAAVAAGPAPAPAEGPAFGRERNLNRFNPEVSVTGIFLGQASDDTREEFRAQEFELDLQSALDPFSRARVTVALSDEGTAEVEEGWVSYSALPGGLQLYAGKFRQRFGPLNRQHLHALPQVDYPLVFQRYFGEEGLAQTGVSIDWTLPHPWADANELTLEITDGENEIFGGESFERLAVLGHFKNFWDLSSAAWLEWGLSGIWGGAPNDGPDLAGTNRVLGTDVTYHWQPPSRAKYRELTWRTEVLLSQRVDGLGLGEGGRQDAWGGYSYLEALVSQNLYAGLRLDRVEDPLDASSRLWGVSPYLTFWQSEFVRLRAELRHLSGDFGDFPENQLFLQLTWAAGPHKHETY